MIGAGERRVLFHLFGRLLVDDGVVLVDGTIAELGRGEIVRLSRHGATRSSNPRSTPVDRVISVRLPRKVVNLSCGCVENSRRRGLETTAWRAAPAPTPTSPTFCR